MKLLGAVNASPDSHHGPSIVTNPAQAATSAEWLLDNGVLGFDLGGQGSILAVSETCFEEESARLAAVRPTLPFLSPPDPLRMERVTEHPVRIVLNFCDPLVALADDFGVRQQIVINPGPGFAPDDWPWDERFVHQQQVYSQLGRSRVRELPLHIAPSWKVTDWHAELLDIVVDANREYGRCH